MPAKPIMKIKRLCPFGISCPSVNCARFDSEMRGDRTFEGQPLRDTKREAGDTYEVAKSAYFQAVENGIPHINEHQSSVKLRVSHRDERETGQDVLTGITRSKKRNKRTGSHGTIISRVRPIVV